MKRWLIGLALVTLLLPLACSQAPSVATPPRPDMPTPTPAPRPPGADQSSPSVPGTERMIVRNGNMSLVVQDVIRARDGIAQIATQLGGYVVSSSLFGQEQELAGSIAIRVPDDKFDQTLSEIRKLAVRVNSESTSSTDVTEEYVDLQSRLKNAEATEQQYLTLLDRAQDVDDILSIYERLSQVRQDIEQLKGRIQYLETVSSMSLISIDLRPVASTKPLARPGWSPVEVLKSAVRGLSFAGQFLATLAIWLIIFLPIWGTALGIILWRRSRKKA